MRGASPWAGIAVTLNGKPGDGRGNQGTECAGINRHVVGDERALQERRSDSILTSSLAPVAARRQVKRRQRHRWAGRLSSEN